MDQIIECIPNVSEGRNKTVIGKLAYSITSVKGVKLLHTDIGESANRTVFTFAGDPESVIEAAFNLIKASLTLIDMRKHTGTHPRLGAVDVCPLVPVSGISMEQTIFYANKLAKRVGVDLNIPVYLYSKSALKQNRVLLEDIRRGEYELLPEKLKNADWIPDYGLSAFIPHFGAIIIGARNFLIAFNVNLNTKDTGIAKKIAGDIRERGRIVRINKKGLVIEKKIPGLLKDVKAIGWYEERYECAQVSTNILNFHNTSIEKVYKTICLKAKKYKIEVIGSEIIGLIPINSVINDFTLSNIGGIENIIQKKIIKFEKKLKMHFWTEKDLMDKILEFKLIKK